MLKLNTRATKLTWTTMTLMATVVAFVALATAGGVWAQDAPGKPTGLTGTVTHDSVNLTWTAPNSGTVDGYQVLRLQRGVDELGDFNILVDDTGATDTTYTDTDVEAEARYVYRVKARNGDDLSEQSNFFNADLPAAPEPPAAPTGLSGTLAHDSVTLTWDDPSDSSITGYQVLRLERDQDPPDTYSVIQDDTANVATTYTDTTVTAEKKYSYTVKARYDDLLSAASNQYDADVPAAPQPPAAPTGLAATATHEAVTLTWNGPADSSITGYQVLRLQRGLDPADTYAVIKDDTENTGTTYTDTGVTAGTNYTYALKAQNPNGLSAQSDGLDVDVPAPPVPAQPTGLTSTNTYTAITLSWDDPDDDTVTGYQVLRRDRSVSGSSFEVLADDTANTDTTYTDSDIAPDGEYEYQVKARNQHGLSEASLGHDVDVPADPDSIVSRAIDLGDLTAVTDSQYPHHQIDGRGDVLDYFKFTITEPRRVHLGIRQQEFNADLFLMDDTTAQKQRGKSEKEGTANEAIVKTLLEGDYLILVVAKEKGDNSYRLRYNTNDPNPDKVAELREKEAEEQESEDPEFVIITDDDPPLVFLNQDSGTTLVSTLGQSHNLDGGITEGSNRSNKFHTGDNPNGYILEEVTIAWRGFPESADEDHVDARIMKSSGDRPSGSTLGTLTTPGTIDPNANNTFNAGEMIYLKPDENYWVEVRATDGDIGKVSTTNSDSYSGEDDWTITNTHIQETSGGDLNRFQQAIRFAVTGREADVLVFNTNETTAHSKNLETGWAYATSFQANVDDDKANGYTLEKVEITWESTTDGDIDNVTVTINESWGTDPGRVLYTLDNPGSLNTVNSFEAPDGAVLDPNRKYWVVVRASGNIGALQATNDDQSGREDWTIDNNSRRWNTSAWESDNHSLQMSIWGKENESPPFQVSNLTETDDSSTTVANDGFVATSFTTGNNPAGYTLKRARVTWATIPSSADPSKIRLSLYSQSGGNPDAELAVFTNPSGYRSDKTTYSFDAPANTDLSPNTEYFIVVKGDGAAAGSLQLTTSDTQSSDYGWSIGNNGRTKTGAGSWATHANSMKMALFADMKALESALVTNSHQAQDRTAKIDDEDTRAFRFTTGSHARGLHHRLNHRQMGQLSCHRQREQHPGQDHGKLREQPRGQRRPALKPRLHHLKREQHLHRAHPGNPGTRHLLLFPDQGHRRRPGKDRPHRQQGRDRAGRLVPGQQPPLPGRRSNNTHMGPRGQTLPHHHHRPGERQPGEEHGREAQQARPSPWQQTRNTAPGSRPAPTTTATPSGPRPSGGRARPGALAM